MLRTELRDLLWNLEFHKTQRTPTGKHIDLYWLAWNEGEAVSLAVPYGRSDIAEFVARSISAGLSVLSALPPGEPFAPGPPLSFRKARE